MVCFEHIFNDGIVNNIVKQPNLYASQDRVKHCNNKKVNSASTNWEQLTQEEFRTFIGCLIFIGIHQLPHSSNYWSSYPALDVKAVSDVFPAKRFKIVENQHVNYNASAKSHGEPGYNKLHKVRLLLDEINKSCNRAYNTSSKLSADKSMIPFKGRSSLKQYMPMKPVKRGFKVWCLADSAMGFGVKFSIYTGKVDTPTSLKLGERAVLELGSVISHTSGLVAFDNFLH